MELFESTSVVAADKASNVSSWTGLEGGLDFERKRYCVLLMFDVKLAHSPKSLHPSIQRCHTRLKNIANEGKNIIHTKRTKVTSQSS